ncbi:MAG: oligosaccharide flippase family protein [Sphingopyxis sp.]|nr:oligosaccharide flippase family protein [Sphingopyxis sp.]
MSFVLNPISGTMLGGFLTKLLAFGMAELAVRLVRLVTVVITARILVPETVGTAALALVLFEILRVLMQIGIGQQIIAAPAHRLKAICNSAQTLFWRWALVVVVVQLLVALGLAGLFGETEAATMLAVLALVYLCMPGGLVSCYLLMREGRAAATARIGAIQTIADHVLGAALLLLWPSPWAIILPKLLTAPIWLMLTRRARPWAPELAAGHVPARTLLPQSLAILATELLAAVRGQGDKLIVGAMLGVSALGTYYFAFNAGVGILSAFTGAFGIILFPTICGTAGAGARLRTFRRLAALGFALLLPAVAVMAWLAPYYVPLIFGDSWAHAAGLIAILALAGIPMLAVALVSAWLRSAGRAQLDAKLAMASCVLALLLLTIGAATHGLAGAALGWVGGMTIVALPALAATLLPRRPKHLVVKRKQP